MLQETMCLCRSQEEVPQSRRGRAPTFSSSLRGSPSSSWEKSRNATEPSMEHTRMPSPFRVLEKMAISSQTQAPQCSPTTEWPGGGRAWGDAPTRSWGGGGGGDSPILPSSGPLSSQHMYRVSLTLCFVRVSCSFISFLKALKNKQL